MRYLLLALCLLATSPAVLAWNAAGHRITCLIAWQQLDRPEREALGALLAAHPDFPRWQARAGIQDAALIFAESCSWPDQIRQDPRYSDDPAGHERPSPLHFPDWLRHRDWHYVNFDAQGQRSGGRLDEVIDELFVFSRSTVEFAQLSWTLPWLTHLVADIHQPLHVGHAEDRGGHRVLIEDPAQAQQPFQRLHSWWDELPGDHRLRGRALRRRVDLLLHQHAAPPSRGSTQDWLKESRELLASAYPDVRGSVSPLVSPEFRAQAERISRQRLVDAGFRLGWLLKEILPGHTAVSRGTAASGQTSGLQSRSKD